MYSFIINMNTMNVQFYFLFQLCCLNVFFALAGISRQTDLPFCESENEVFEHNSGFLNDIESLSATKRSGKKHNAHERNSIFRRYSGPFAYTIPLPWTCSIEHFWRDLGTDHFPRYIADGVCLNTTCWYGHYSCAPMRYSVNVLQQQPEVCVDRHLPNILASQWRLRTFEVTSSCVCKRVF